MEIEWRRRDLYPERPPGRSGHPSLARAPPWGTLSAINLNTGEYAWKIPFGEYPELAAKGMKDTGSENYGGPVVTAGGLVFGGSSEGYFYALDANTGKPLWHFMAGAQIVTNPVSFLIRDKQYVAITAGLSLFVFALN